VELVPELVEADTAGHLRPHEAWMDDGDDDARILQVVAEQLARHVEGRFACVVRIVTLGSRAEGDASGLGRDEHDFGTLV